MCGRAQPSPPAVSRSAPCSHSTIAGRLAGAYRRIGRDDIADEVVSTMKAADYPIRSEIDPFLPYALHPPSYAGPQAWRTKQEVSRILADFPPTKIPSQL